MADNLKSGRSEFPESEKAVLSETQENRQMRKRNVAGLGKSQFRAARQRRRLPKQFRGPPRLLQKLMAHPLRWKPVLL